MPSTIRTLFPPARRKALATAVPFRTSCRSFLGVPAQEAMITLSYLAGRYALPGARLVLLRADDSCFSASLAGVARITGCQLAAAVIVQGESWRNRLHAGIIGEALALEAAAMGLGSCWVTGSLRRGILPVSLLPGEELLGAIALGLPASPLTATPVRPRKSPEQFCAGNWRIWPEELIHAGTLVQLAPSTLNLQPWVLRAEDSGAFTISAPAHAALDAGIALCHAELALSTPHDWSLHTAPGEILLSAMPR